jgi:ankyrin repeat protein
MPEICRACAAGELDRVKQLIEKEHISPDFTQPNSNFTLLMFAAREGHIAVVRYLLDAGATIDTGGLKAAGTAMMQSVENRKADIVKVLLDHGAKVSARDPAQNTAMFYAASNNDTEMLDLLLSHKADVNVHNMNSHTPLHSAAREGHAEAIHWLVNHGCELNTPNVRKWSPLHVAVLKGHKLAARALLSHKATCCLQCPKCTPLIELGNRLPPQREGHTSDQSIDSSKRRSGKDSRLSGGSLQQVVAPTYLSFMHI